MRLKNFDTNKILHGPEDNIDRVLRTKDKLLGKGIDCEIVYFDDTKQYAVVKLD